MNRGAVTSLLDVNVLVALAWPQHVHHQSAHAWFKRRGPNPWTSCPLTQLAFVRVSSNAKIVQDAVSPREAMGLLRKVTALLGHRFWADDALPTGQRAFDSVTLVGGCLGQIAALDIGSKCIYILPNGHLGQAQAQNQSQEARH